jgi:hypothetical protein
MAGELRQSAALHAPADVVTSPLNDPPREAEHGGTPEWLLRITIESLLIVLSILLALAVDGWRDSRHNHQVAVQSLQIFEREIKANQARIEDGVPYHIGLRDVVAGMADDPERATEVRGIVEGLEPAVLLSTAWETALATGALTHMDVETVSALSLTYSLQDRFSVDSRAGIPRFVILPTTTPQEKMAQVQQTLAYLTNLVRSEQQLQAVYTQALEVTHKALNRMAGRRDSADAADSAAAAAAADTAGAVRSP